MELIIHRGAREVGGSCIEIISGKSSIIIDAGLPLSSMEGDSKKDCLPQPLFNDMLSGETKPDAVFLSHAHPDHYGLASFLPRISQSAAGKRPKVDGIVISPQPFKKSDPSSYAF